MKTILALLNIRLDKMKVNEEFASIQGEISVGRLAYFIRLSGCNLACGFCDSKHAWDAGVETKVDELVTRAENFPMVVITGGEPMLQREEVAKLVNKLKKKNPSIRIEIETNGTIQPTGINKIDNVFFNVSVKLKNSDNEFSKRINRRVISWYNDVGANFKFVVDNQDDIDEVSLLVQDMGIKKGQVFLMPEGCDRDTQWKKTEKIITLAKNAGFNFSPRFHVLLWDTERGK